MYKILTIHANHIISLYIPSLTFILTSLRITKDSDALSTTSYNTSYYNACGLQIYRKEDYEVIESLIFLFRILYLNILCLRIRLQHYVCVSYKLIIICISYISIIHSEMCCISHIMKMGVQILLPFATP